MYSTRGVSLEWRRLRTGSVTPHVQPLPRERALTKLIVGPLHGVHAGPRCAGCGPLSFLAPQRLCRRLWHASLKSDGSCPQASLYRILI
eukprot:UN2585